MLTRQAWVRQYEAAMVETNPQRLAELIVTARQAVHQRLRDIEADSNHHHEREDIVDALNHLRLLEREK